MSIYHSKCSCISCHREYSIKAIFTHYERSHGENQIKSKYRSGFTDSDRAKAVEKANTRKQELILDHIKSPTYCTHCTNILSFEKRNNKFCSHSCSALHNNQFQTRTHQKNHKISESIRQYHEKRKQEKQDFLINFVGPIFVKHSRQSKQKPTTAIVGEYCKVYFCNCKFCGNKFAKQSVKQICDSCKDLHKKLYVDYRFKFNIYEFSDLFDISLLTQVGWYSPRGKSGKWNPHGLSRDHKVSVSEAIKNKYDPFYITHPLNCELMSHIENNKKKQKSSISYHELVQIVDEYEKCRR